MDYKRAAFRSNAIGNSIKQLAQQICSISFQAYQNRVRKRTLVAIDRDLARIIEMADMLRKEIADASPLNISEESK